MSNERPYPINTELKTYLFLLDSDQREQLESELGTSITYLYQCANGHRRVGLKLAERLSQHSGLTLAQIRGS